MCLFEGGESMKQIVVKDFCVACGNCFSKSEFFKESRSGHAKVANSSAIRDVEAEKLQGIIDECPARAIEAINSSSSREVKDTPKISKKFSLLKIFGNLELSEIVTPDVLSAKMLMMVKNKGQDIYEKLEHMIILIILSSEPKNKTVTIDDGSVSIQCQMKSRSHRLNMDKYEIKKYFDIPEGLLNIYKNEEDFKIVVNKNVLLRILLLTILFEEHGKKINKLAHEEIVSFIDSFIDEKFGNKVVSVEKDQISEVSNTDQYDSELQEDELEYIEELSRESQVYDQQDNQDNQDNYETKLEEEMIEAVEEPEVEEQVTEEIQDNNEITEEEPVVNKSLVNKKAIEKAIAEAITGVTPEESIINEDDDDISKAIVRDHHPETTESLNENEYEMANVPDSVKKFNLLKIFGDLEIDEIYKPDILSIEMLEVIKSKGKDVYKKLEQAMLVNVLDSDLKYIGVLIKDSYIYIKYVIEPRVYKLIEDKEEIIKYFDVSNDVQSDEALKIYIDENDFEIYIGKTILLKIFLLTSLYEKYQNNINKISKAIISEYTEILIDEFIARNKFSVKEMLPEDLLLIGYNTEKYRETYDIKYLFTDKEIKRVATRRDVSAIFNRDFYSLGGKDLSGGLEQFKAKCMSLVNGTNTIEYIVDYYIGNYD